MCSECCIKVVINRKRESLTLPLLDAGNPCYHDMFVIEPNLSVIMSMKPQFRQSGPHMKSLLTLRCSLYFNLWPAGDLRGDAGGAPSYIFSKMTKMCPSLLTCHPSPFSLESLIGGLLSGSYLGLYTINDCDGMFQHFHPHRSIVWVVNHLTSHVMRVSQSNLCIPWLK